MKEKHHYSLDDLLNKRRSVRKFRRNPISMEITIKLKDAARKAPSAGGIRPVSIYFVDTSEIREKIYHASMRQKVILNSRLIIIFCVDYSKMYKRYGNRSNRYALLEVGHMAQNVCLKALDLGLVTCCVGAFRDNRIQRILNCEEKPVYMIAVGYPK